MVGSSLLELDSFCDREVRCLFCILSSSRRHQDASSLCNSSCCVRGCVACLNLVTYRYGTSTNISGLHQSTRGFWPVDFGSPRLSRTTFQSTVFVLAKSRFQSSATVACGTCYTTWGMHCTVHFVPKSSKSVNFCLLHSKPQGLHGG